ncbi:hypothetical protein AC579_5681 [Pseudocercospora musae]|uniref:Uncharacterized protein n=1 Tax=Pseudocercospora musae TaxID=113226 RepID=A0A139HCJ0_9PEZI|nr:hypothetical protein AC579_5681 [Pseudocercospora musae]
MSFQPTSPRSSQFIAFHNLPKFHQFSSAGEAFERAKDKNWRRPNERFTGIWKSAANEKRARFNDADEGEIEHEPEP